MTESVDAVVIGAGVVGLAVARALALRGREVIVLEAAEGIGTGISSRNSEVIHAGIYYPADSAKARYCVAGRDLLYRYAAEHGVAHRRCGKLIVATDDSQRPALEKIRLASIRNGAGDLPWLSAAEARAMEPELSCLGALWSPDTGIVDSHSFMLALLGDAEERGAMLAIHAPVTGGRVVADGIELAVGGAEPMVLRARTVVNSAGLDAQAISLTLAGLDPAPVPPAYLAKGNYYVLSGVKPPFTRLIYPAPEQAGLGIHVTLDMGGQVKFGPDVEWVETRSYEVDPRRADRFYAAVRSYWPALPDGALSPGYAGIRPKLQKPGEAARDFVIQGPAETGAAGYVALYGIESPGLTSALAIAEDVAELAR
jgi:L-2-hydroxyglutarate oxidase LhgO